MTSTLMNYVWKLNTSWLVGSCNTLIYVLFNAIASCALIDTHRILNNKQFVWDAQLLNTAMDRDNAETKFLVDSRLICIVPFSYTQKLVNGCLLNHWTLPNNKTSGKIIVIHSLCCIAFDMPTRYYVHYSYISFWNSSMKVCVLSLLFLFTFLAGQCSTLLICYHPIIKVQIFILSIYTMVQFPINTHIIYGRLRHIHRIPIDLHTPFFFFLNKFTKYNRW